MAQVSEVEARDTSGHWLDRRVVAWTGYDVASSAYYGVVPPGLFPIFYLTGVLSGGDGFLSWGITVSLALVLAGCLAPAVGRLADRNGWHWRMLAATTVVYCLATATLSFVGRGEIAFSLAVFTVAQAAYLLSVPLYEAYLPAIATPRTMGRVSGFGWAVGFTGGIIAIVAAWPFAADGAGPENFARYRESFAIVAGITLVLAIPSLLALRQTRIAPSRDIARPSLTKTLRNWRDHETFFKLLLAYYMISDAMITIAVFASAFFTARFGSTMREILTLLLIVTVVALPATLASGFIATRWGQKNTLAGCIAIWVAAVMVMAFGQGAWAPVAAAVLLGMVFGSTQSIFRSLLGQTMPRSRAAEFFGFNAWAGRVSAAAGPILYGVVAAASGSQRLALLSVLVFILAGAWILRGVRVERP